MQKALRQCLTPEAAGLGSFCIVPIHLVVMVQALLAMQPESTSQASMKHIRQAVDHSSHPAVHQRHGTHRAGFMNRVAIPACAQVWLAGNLRLRSAERFCGCMTCA